MEEFKPKNINEKIPSEYEKSIQEVFTLCPELEKIGSGEEYGKYLETIFPESKVKDVVYHGTGTSLFGEAGKGFKKKMWDVTYFTKDYQYANKFAKRSGANFGTEGILYPAVLNIATPINLETVASWHIEKIIDKLQSGENDSVIGIEQGENVESIGVYSPEQIHILGSKSDIEAFKEFVTR